MNKSVLAFLILVGVGSAVMIGYYFARPYIDAEKNKFTSDASGTKGYIKIGVDNWIGYFPLCSSHMRTLMRSAGYQVECVDDKADYAARFRALEVGDLQFAVGTVDSYIVNGRNQDYPGTIVAVIDESKGGDALVAQKSKLKSLEDLKKKKDYKIALTPASPSEHLLRGVSVHFDIPHLKQKSSAWLVETDGSTEALEKLKKGEVDAAVLWEPDVSKALSDKKYVKLLGTEDTEKLIVDILIVQREFSEDNPEVVGLLLSNYFRALKHYQSNPSELQDEVKQATDLSKKRVKAMLDGVKWVNLYNNAIHWFGIKDANTKRIREGVVETVESTIQILISTNELRSNPLPKNNPYFLQNRKYVEELFSSGLKNQFGATARDGVGSPVNRKFAKISSFQWKQLRPIGTLKIRPITFQSGTSRLDEGGKEQLDYAKKNLEHYPNFRVLIKGHTGKRGDPKANRKLSQSRADAVRKYLISKFGIHKNRLRSVGLGASEPLPRRSGESRRSYNYRLPRVELSLVSEVY